VGALYVNVREGEMVGRWLAFEPWYETDETYCICTEGLSTCKTLLQKDGPTHMWIDGKALPYRYAKACHPDEEADVIYLHECGYSLAYDSTIEGATPTREELYTLERLWAKEESATDADNRRDEYRLLWHFSLRKVEDEIENIIDELKGEFCLWGNANWVL
jgi:hypothetical protein